MYALVFLTPELFTLGLHLIQPNKAIAAARAVGSMRELN